MAWYDKIIGGGLGAMAEGAASIIEALQAGKIKKHEAEAMLQELKDRELARGHEDFKAELGAKERIIVAELQQGDTFTKRARPFVIYTGPVIVFALAIMYYISWWKNTTMPPTPDFILWYLGAWAGYGSVYAFGRTKEKLGAGNSFTKLVTGASNATLT
jgi:hypothetical protein